MILPGLNLLVYAYNSSDQRHEEAKRWWTDCLRNPQRIGLAWVVVLGFIRLTTSPKLHRNPYTTLQATKVIEDWFRLPHIHLVEPATDHFTRLKVLLQEVGTAGNITTDAHLATLAMEHGYLLYSNDDDFARFPKLRWVNPLIPVRGKK